MAAGREGGTEADVAVEQETQHSPSKTGSAKHVIKVYRTLPPRNIIRYVAAARVPKKFITKLHVRTIDGCNRVLFAPEKESWAIDVIEHLQIAATKRVKLFTEKDVTVCYTLAFVCSPRVAPRYPAIASILRSATFAPIVRIVVTSILGWRDLRFYHKHASQYKKSPRQEIRFSCHLWP